MLRLAPSTLRSVARTRSAQPTRRLLSSSSSHAAQRNGLRSPFASRGAALVLASLAGAALLVHTRGTVLLDAPVSVVTRSDPDTGIEFPETLVIPSRVRLPPLTLVGLGVRRVSFLGIKVYSVGFYADLTNPHLKIPENATPEEQIDYIVSNTPCVLRIVPTRSTSYSHLRDGFLRALQARMSAQLKDGTLSAQEAEDAQSPLRKLKSMFPSTPLAKGVPLEIILLSPPKNLSEKRTLIVRDLGSVDNNWLSKEFFMAYFEGSGLSPPMKKSAIAFLREVSGKPVDQ
ncbi:hypothetical protein M0805_008306 [Coniferiporia weirii]|nr:hypothetical protein M0805_008306 [Coniferiporia weirii]